jgi:hypothetical protein
LLNFKFICVIQKHVISLHRNKAQNILIEMLP